MSHFQYSLIKLSVPEGYILGKWWGPQKARPILCIHGWMDNCGSFDKLIPLLPKDYAYLAFDLPGHGLSSRYGPGMLYNFYDFIVHIERIRKAYGWDKVSLMGHSLGAMICAYYAAVFPDKVDLLVCLDNFTPKEFDIIEKMRENMGPLLAEDDRFLAKGSDKRSEPPSYSYEQLLDKRIHGSRYSLDKEAATFILGRCVKNSTKYPNKYYFNHDRRLHGLACPAANREGRITMISNITCPVLFLIGKDSYMRDSPFVPTLKEIEEIKQNFFYQYGPGNHHFLLTHPEAYSESICKFLDKYRGAKSRL